MNFKQTLIFNYENKIQVMSLAADLSKINKLSLFAAKNAFSLFPKKAHDFGIQRAFSYLNQIEDRLEVSLDADETKSLYDAIQTKEIDNELECQIASRHHMNNEELYKLFLEEMKQLNHSGCIKIESHISFGKNESTELYFPNEYY